MLDHPLVRALIMQRDLAMNNWAIQAMRVAELEAELNALREARRNTENTDAGMENPAA